MLALLNGGFQPGNRFLALVTRRFEFGLLGLLLVQQRLLFALFLFQLGFLRRHVFAGLLELGDGFLPRLVQVAEIGL